MTNLIKIVTGLSLLWLSCAPATGPSPPIPTTQSIIPLSKGNSWIYSFSHYDTVGACIDSSMSLDLSIPEIYTLNNDTELVPLFTTYNLPSGTPYYYKYEYEGLDSGFIITNRGTGDVNRGVYIVGEYNHSEYTLYKVPILWLAYPADSGKIWTIQFEGKSDSSIMEIISTKRDFYLISSTPNSISPVTFKSNCYLYKETAGTTVSYYYYHEDIGALGFLHYENGVLRRSFILKDFYIGVYER